MTSVPKTSYAPIESNPPPEERASAKPRVIRKGTTVVDGKILWQGQYTDASNIIQVRQNKKNLFVFV